jgi:hypothetical protein
LVGLDVVVHVGGPPFHHGGPEHWVLFAGKGQSKWFINLSPIIVISTIIIARVFPLEVAALTEGWLVVVVTGQCPVASG